jgi:hypothetical protein
MRPFEAVIIYMLGIIVVELAVIAGVAIFLHEKALK